jgi:predicted nucleic acid-binding protein
VGDPLNPRANALLDAHEDDTSVVFSELCLTELYVLIRNPAIMARPLGPSEAVDVIQKFRRHPRWRIVDHSPAVMDEVWRLARTKTFARRRIYDVRLGLSLVRAGVKRFATRNVKDFQGIGFDEVFDPLAEGPIRVHEPRPRRGRLRGRG